MPFLLLWMCLFTPTWTFCWISQLPANLTETDHAHITVVYLAEVKKLFEEHKPIFLGVSGFLILVLLIMIFYCYRRCCGQDKKQQRKPSSTNHALSMSHEEFHLPRWKKSAVQPRQNKQKEIVRGSLLNTLIFIRIM